MKKLKSLNFITPKKYNEGLNDAKTYHKTDDILICEYREIMNLLNFKNPVWLGVSSPSGYDAIYKVKYHPEIHVYVYKSSSVSYGFIKKSDLIKLQKK